MSPRGLIFNPLYNKHLAATSYATADYTAAHLDHYFCLWSVMARLTLS